MKTLILKCKYTVNTCLKLWLLKEQNEFDFFSKDLLLTVPTLPLTKLWIIAKNGVLHFFFTVNTCICLRIYG